MTVKKHSLVLGVILSISFVCFIVSTYFVGLHDDNFWGIYITMISLPLIGIFIHWYSEVYIKKLRSTIYLLLLSIVGFLMPVLTLFIYHRTLPYGSYGSDADCGGGMLVRHCIAGGSMGRDVNDFYKGILFIVSFFIASQVLFVILNRGLRLSKNIAAIICIIAWIGTIFYLKLY